MLQQTTARTAARFYAAFVSRFGSLEALAAASEDQVLTLWSGLGYYHRARNLHRAAGHLLRTHGGVFPRTLEAALAVPGVGLYTASAILSIAYGQPLPVVDGNVRRVLARLFCLSGPAWRRDGPFYNLAEELLDRQAPGDWNQALMELGATLCTPRRPSCPACPLRDSCEARLEGHAEALPEGKTRRLSVSVTVIAALVEKAGRVLLVRRADGPLLGRLWEVPQTSLDCLDPPDLLHEARLRHGLELELGELAVVARHAVTHRRIRAEGYRARVMGNVPADPERFRWVSAGELGSLPVSSLTRKLVGGLASPQRPLPLG